MGGGRGADGLPRSRGAVGQARRRPGRRSGDRLSDNDDTVDGSIGDPARVARQDHLAALKLEHRDLDAATCPLLERSLRYRPAQDATGRPVAETILRS